VRLPRCATPAKSRGLAEVRAIPGVQVDGGADGSVGVLEAWLEGGVVLGECGQCCHVPAGRAARDE